MSKLNSLVKSAPILVVGSAHLDIIARSTSRDDVLDRIGEVDIEVGGTACNIAINLVQIGAPVRFFTAMNKSAYSRVIADYLGEMGVETHIDYRPELPTAAFSAHLDETGEIVSAISATPIESVVFDLERYASLLNGAAAVVLDCNLSAAMLDAMVLKANALGVPAYVMAVSEEKCLRIAKVDGHLAGLFFNGLEFTFFCSQALGAEMSPSAVARMLNAMLLISDGQSGSVLALPDGSQVGIQPPNIGGEGSRLGMGDAQAAGMIYGLAIQAMPTIEAAKNAIVLAKEVSERKHCHTGKTGGVESAIKKAQHGEGHDAMTGALNRRSTERELNKALKQRGGGTVGALAVLILDIDHFKSVNDTWGHNVGDDVIIACSKAATGCLRDSDFLGRWGGEEFVVSLPNTTMESALMIAERIRSTVEQEIRSPRQITVSIGCAESTGELHEDLKSLVARADGALYEAKQGGRNRVVAARNRDTSSN